MTDIVKVSVPTPDQSIILVHGAWHDARCWSHLSQPLKKAGYQVLAPDLPGHGENLLPLKRVSLRRYCDHLCEILEQQDTPVTLLGHSMAGVVISEAACRLPEKVSQLIYLCAYLPRSGESLFDLIRLNRERHGPCQIEELLQLSDDKRHCTIPPSHISSLFYQKVPEEQQAILLSQFNTQASLPLSTATTFNQDILSKIPKNYISCSEDRVIPPSHQRAMISRQACQALFQLDADHSPFYSAPNALASLLFSLLSPEN